MKSSYKRYTLAGPGGIKCPCCGGKGHRKATEKRIAKRRFNVSTDKLVNDTLAAGSQQ